MAHNFEQSFPHHTIHHIKMPEGHAHLDEKTQKMGRSPMAGQLPMENGLESAQNEPNLAEGQANLGGQGSF